jgi:hypothetical protein
MAIIANSSTKRKLIDRANTTVVVIAGVTAFVFVFSLIATKTLISQAKYQNRVITADHQTLSLLKTDLTSASQLETSYNNFTSTSQNIIGGDPAGNGPNDGNNTKIVLDALPSNYDFPAMITSLETLVGSSVTLNSISGTDQEATQGSDQSSATPQPVPMPFQISVSSDYASIQSLISEFEHSIRPIQIQSLDISGDQSNLVLNISGQTYYQPAESLNISTKVVQ